MFLTKSIRRKLVLSLVFIIAILTFPVASGVYGILAGHALIDDVAAANTAAKQWTEMVRSCSKLLDPLYAKHIPAAERLVQLKEIIGQTKAATSLVADQMAEATSIERQQAGQFAQPAINLLFGLLSGLEEGAELVYGGGPISSEPESELATLGIRELGPRIAEIQVAVRSIPAPILGTQKTRRAANDVFENSMISLVGATIFSVCLLGILVYLAYAWIFRPVKELHRAMQKAARGDYSVRINLRGRDEIVDLGFACDNVIQRFDETQRDLNNQVIQRSKQLVLSERLGNVGILAAGMAHEINNPLSAITIAADSLSDRLDAHPDIHQPLSESDWEAFRDYLTMIRQEAFRCQQIISKLLDFARGQDGPKTRQDLTRVVSEVIAITKHLEQFRGHKIIFQHAGACWVEMNGAEMKQVVLNLLTNAAESMDGAGLITIAISELTDSVALTISDNGSGMSERVQQNLFEPFFTEKKTGRGTGLGLSISHRIVADHGGRIEPYSAGPGTGSTFRVQIPRRAANQAA